MRRTKKQKQELVEEIINISNKEKEILDSYKDIATDIDNIEEFIVNDYTKQDNHQEEQELEEFEVDAVKVYENKEEEEEPIPEKKKVKPKKEKLPKPKKKKIEKYDFSTNEEETIEEYEIEEYNQKPLPSKEKFSLFKNKNNDKKKISSNLIINIIFTIIILLILLVVFDIVMVSKFEKGPFFSVLVNEYDDGGTKEYYGLGYKVIKYNQILGRRDMEIGTWSLEYNSEPIYLDAIDLAIEINKNESSAYRKFYKKFLGISGILQDVDTDNKTLTISYLDDGGKYNIDIICKMAEENEDLSIYEINNEITVLGVMNGYKSKSKKNNTTVEMKNCFAEQ